MQKEICSVEECDRPMHAKGMCSMHRMRFTRYGNTGDPRAQRQHTKKPCEFKGCDRSVKSKGLCSKHYARLLRHGDPAVDLKSKPHNPCSIEGCENRSRSHGMCGTHRARVMKHGDPNVVKPFAEKGEKHSNWRGDQVSYSGAHRRLYRNRGTAKKHECQHCGGRASQWAYDWTDPDPLMEMTPGGIRYYSGDINRYLPLCAPCHKTWDLDRIDSNG